MINHKFIKHLGRVAVLYGGNSPERSVSLVSGTTIYEALKKVGVLCTLIDTADRLIEQLQSLQPDRAFIALHGINGEDGTVQGLLHTMGIPYTGSDVLSSALALDKYRTKLIWKSLNMPTPEFVMVTSSKALPTHYPFPCFVKTTRSGSTLGNYPIDDRQHLPQAISQALKLGPEVLIEKWIQGREFTVGILKEKPLPVIRIESTTGYYDYTAKYQSQDTQYLIPCGLTDAQEQEMKTLAYRAFTALGCKHWGRIDFMEDKNGQFWLIEANTIPGMTTKSLMPVASASIGIDFSSLILEVLQCTIN